MTPKVFTYPFDPSGLAFSNKIPSESHTITPANGSDFRFIVPKAAPYFARSMVVKHPGTGKTLQRGVDWVPGHRFVAGSNTAPYQEIYGSILLLDSTLNGTFKLEPYQTLGGEYTIDETTALEVLANKLLDPRLTTWDKVIDAPLVYDVLTHLHHVSGSVGYDSMVAALQNLVMAFTLESSKLNDRISAHAGDTLNPHKLSLTQLGIDRFANVYRESLEAVLKGEGNINYVTAYQLAQKISKEIDIIGKSGQEGQLAYYTGAAAAFSTISDYVLNNVAVVENAADLTVQLAARENFLQVYNSWQRIAMSGNNLTGTPGELTGWSYDAASDAVLSTINSNSLIGLVCPEQVSGDYVFEVEVSSTNSDDDYIGISLGLAVVDGKMRNLSLMRSASNPTSSGAPTAIASMALTYDFGGQGATALATIPGLLNYPNGWAGYTAGVVKLRVRRVGTVLYMSTTNPGGDYLPEVAYDLNSKVQTQVFAGSVNLGYIAFSQAAAKWKTLRRTGANPVIVATHNQQVSEWNGSTYVLTAKTPKDILKKGRFYKNHHFSRVYYCPAPGTVNLVTNAIATYEPTTAAKQRGRAAVVLEDGVVWAGQKLQLTSADGTPAGAIQITAGKMEFVNAAGQVMAYFDTNKQFMHSGSTYMSDKRFKDITQLISNKGVLPYYEWVWKEHPCVPDHFWGTKGWGVLAQDVLKVLPQFVHESPEHGFLSVDETKLALYLSLVGGCSKVD